MLTKTILKTLELPQERFVLDFIVKDKPEAVQKRGARFELNKPYR